MRTTIHSLLLATALGFGSAMFLPTAALANHTGTGVYVNGVELTAQQIAYLYHSTGQIPQPGNYVVRNGCVTHLESGQVSCSHGAQPGYGGGYGGGGYGSGYGYNSGEGSPWFYRGSDASGGYSVGGDGSGCIYTPDWSNC